MKRIKLSEEAYRKLEEYRRKISEELGREVSYSEALARLLRDYSYVFIFESLIMPR